MTYLVITGNHTSTKTAPEYVEHIVYGTPEIRAVLVGSHFIAICTYEEEQAGNARHTFDRMGSFPHGVSLTHDVDVAYREFGSWVAHFAPKAVAA